MNRTAVRRMLRSRRGMSGILAALLMVAVVITVGVIVYAWATGLFGSLMGSAPSVKEGIPMDASSVSGSTITMTLRNVGSFNIKLDSYYVVLGSTQVCTGSLTTTIAVQTISSISLTGSTLTSGVAYDAKIITSNGNQFTFQVTG